MPFKKKNKSHIEHFSSKQLCKPRGTGRAPQPALPQPAPRGPRLFHSTFTLPNPAAGPLGLSRVLPISGSSSPRPAHHLRPLPSRPLPSGSAPSRLTFPRSRPSPPCLSSQAPPRPGSSLRSCSPLRAARGRCDLPLHFLPPFPPDAAVGARVKPGGRRAHHGKSEPATRASPGFGAAAAAGCAPGGAPHLLLRPSPDGRPRRSGSEPERSGTEAQSPASGPGPRRLPDSPRHGARAPELALKFSVPFGSAGIRTRDLVQAGHGAPGYPIRAAQRSPAAGITAVKAPLALSPGQDSARPAFSVGPLCARPPWLTPFIFWNLMTFCPLGHFHPPSKFRALLFSSWRQGISVSLK